MEPMNNHFVHKPLPERLVLFGVAFALWIVLVWPVSPLDGRLLWGDILAGAVVVGSGAVVVGAALSASRA